LSQNIEKGGNIRIEPALGSKATPVLGLWLRLLYSDNG